MTHDTYKFTLFFFFFLVNVITLMVGTQYMEVLDIPMNKEVFDSHTSHTSRMHMKMANLWIRADVTNPFSFNAHFGFILFDEQKKYVLCKRAMESKDSRL